MKLPSLADEWALFQFMVAPEGATIETRTRMHVAFYGGMYVVLTHMRAIMDCEDNQEAHAAYQTMFDEMHAYHESMRSRREQREKDDV